LGELLGNTYAAYRAGLIGPIDALKQGWGTLTYKVRTSERSQGLIQYYAGVGEIYGGVTMTGTGALAVPGTALALHGMDTSVAGLRRFATGEHANTATYSLAYKITGSSEAAELVDLGIPMLSGVAGLAYGVGRLPTVARIAETDATAVRGLGSRGVRNTEVLTESQQAQVFTHVDELGLDPNEFHIGSSSSYYSENFDFVVLGPDVFPAQTRTANTVFERLTPRAVIAHEAGHMVTSRAGTAFEAGSLFDEVGASLTGRQMPGLTNVERYQLLRDAAERAQGAGLGLRDVILQMQGK
jgi:hypothetical protein